MDVSAKVVLLDIEGTTSSVSYVYDILFPYARQNFAEFLNRRLQEEKVKAACNQLAVDTGAAGLDEFNCSSESELIHRIIKEANKLMDADVKATGLKELQGLIWAEGYEKGELKSHVYEDVPGALKKWKESGLDIRIFSSGSVGAQKVFFKNTESGDLGKLFSAHYDTTTGPKREAESYLIISKEAGMKPEEIIFLSDVVEELDAAKQAGMKTVLVKRPGNKPVSNNHGHEEITSFEQLHLAIAV